jgi:methylated-DNA-[protein]-cysteine S-methyltransferase
MSALKNTSCISVTTPIGKIRVVWTQEGNRRRVLRVLLPGSVQEGNSPSERTLSRHDGQSHDDMALLCLKIQEFLRGGAVEFSLKEMDMSACSAFQRDVYMQTRRIPRGRVMSYGHLAEAIGILKGARAVGTALARNPFPLVIPCHRVVRTAGELGGFGGGLKLKKTLLEMEGITFDQKGRVLQNCFLHSMHVESDSLFPIIPVFSCPSEY